MASSFFPAALEPVPGSREFQRRPAEFSEPLKILDCIGETILLREDFAQVEIGPGIARLGP